MSLYTGKEVPESERDLPVDPLQRDHRQTILNVLRVISLRRWFFFIPFCVGLTAAFLVSHQIPRQYVVRTIFERRDDPILKSVVNGNFQTSFDTLRRSMSLDLMGRESLRQAVLDLEWAAHLPRSSDGSLTPESGREVAALIADIEQSIRLKMLESSNNLDLVEVSYAGRDPVLAAEVLNRLRDNYLMRTRQRIGTLLSESQSFFNGRVEEGRAKLESNRLAEEGLLRGLPEGVDPRKPESVDVLLSSLRLQREELERKEAELASRITSRKNQLGAPRAGVSDPDGEIDVEVAALADHAVIRLQGELETVKRRIKELQTTRRMKESHPDMQSYIREQAQLESALIDARREAIERLRAIAANESGRPALQELPPTAEARQALAELESLKSLSEMNTGAMARTDARIAALEQCRPTVRDRYQKYLGLQKEEETLRTSLRVWEDNLASVTRWFEVEGGDKGSSFRTIEPARPTQKAFSPRASTVFIFCVLLALVLGAAGVLLAELFDPTLRTATQVMKCLEIPIIEGISEIVTPQAGRQRFLRRVVLQPVLAVAMLLVVSAVGTSVYLRLERPVQYAQLKEVSEQTVSGMMTRVGLGG